MSSKKVTKPQKKPFDISRKPSTAIRSRVGGRTDGRPRRTIAPQSAKAKFNRQQQHANLRARTIKSATGSMGMDPRKEPTATVDPQPLVKKDQIELIILNPGLVKQSYWTPILTICSDAYSRGFAASSQALGSPFAPYYAFCFIVQLLENGIEAVVPNAGQAPKWLALLYQRLSPARAPFRTAVASYKFLTDPTMPGGFGSTPPNVIPWNEEGTGWAFGSVNGTAGNVNGYLTLLMPPPYTQQLGQESYDLLLQFFANSGAYPMWQQVDITAPLTEDPDVSAFAAAYNELGGALGSPSGTTTEVFSEVFLKSPILAVFSSYEQVTYRAFFLARLFGGGGCYLGGRVQEMSKLIDITNKQRPLFKLVDFNEFYEVCGLWLAGVLTANAQNTTATGQISVPLSVQDFRIMLRQAIMSINQYSQSMVQDLVFTGVDRFLPFLVSAGTCGKNIGTTVELPIILVENIRALIRRMIAPTDNNEVGAIDWLPVWGMWSSDIENITNYTYVVADQTYNVFFVPEGEETPINLIDGSAIVSETPLTVAYVDLNGSQLSDNIASWNEWLATVSANSGTLSPIGLEKGITVLEVLTLSTVSVALPPLNALAPEPTVASPTLSQKPSATSRRSAEKPRVFGTGRRERRKYGGAPVGGVAASPYSGWCPNLVCSNQPVLNSAWSEAQIYWILPCMRTSGIISDPGNYSCYMSAVAEPNNFYLGAYGSVAGVLSREGIDTLYNSHLRLAALMYGPEAFRSNSLEDFLTQAATTGRGSFLGQIAGGFLGGLFGQGEAGAAVGGAIF